MPTVNSSCISRVEYDPAMRAMRITFRSGRTYTLPEVPEHHYIEILRASSAGRYFNRYLRGRY